jgi:two-component system, OmpR family, response regulator VicR
MSKSQNIQPPGLGASGLPRAFFRVILEGNMSLGTIVLIEDDQILSDLLSEDLKEAGFEVITAYDGQSGVDLVKRQRPSLILLDLVLPKKSGFDVLREIKDMPAGSDLPVVILSMLSDDDTVSKGLELGAADYVVKSDKASQEIVSKVKQYVMNSL